MYNEAGQGACKKCLAGKYNDKANSKDVNDCKDCGLGKYNALKGQSAWKIASCASRASTATSSGFRRRPVAKGVVHSTLEGKHLPYRALCAKLASTPSGKRPTRAKRAAPGSTTGRRDRKSVPCARYIRTTTSLDGSRKWTARNAKWQVHRQGRPIVVQGRHGVICPVLDLERDRYRHGTCLCVQNVHVHQTVQGWSLEQKNVVTKVWAAKDVYCVRGLWKGW